METIVSDTRKFVRDEDGNWKMHIRNSAEEEWMPTALTAFVGTDTANRLEQKAET